MKEGGGGGERWMSLIWKAYHDGEWELTVSHKVLREHIWRAYHGGEWVLTVSYQLLQEIRSPEIVLLEKSCPNGPVSYSHFPLHHLLYLTTIIIIGILIATCHPFRCITF